VQRWQPSYIDLVDQQSAYSPGTFCVSYTVLEGASTGNMGIAVKTQGVVNNAYKDQPYFGNNDYRNGDLRGANTAQPSGYTNPLCVRHDGAPPGTVSAIRLIQVSNGYGHVQVSKVVFRPDVQAPVPVQDTAPHNAPNNASKTSTAPTPSTGTKK